MRNFSFARASLLFGVSLALGVAFFSPPVCAQTPADATASPSSAPVAVGDHWTFELRDEITGTTKGTRTTTVTDISNNQIAARSEGARTGRGGIVVYDMSWNLLRDASYRYSPNDGSGIRSPLALGATWNISTDAVNTGTGATWKRKGTARVTGQETIATKAGQFEIFLVEANVTGRNIKDPTRVVEFSARTWFSPSLNHWVKRNILIREGGHIFQNLTSELIEYGHKQ